MAVSTTAPQWLLADSQSPLMVVEESGKAWFSFIDRLNGTPFEAPIKLYSDDGGIEQEVATFGLARQGGFLALKDGKINFVYNAQSGQFYHHVIDTQSLNISEADTSALGDKSYYPAMHIDRITGYIYLSSFETNVNLGHIAVNVNDRWYPFRDIEYIERLDGVALHPAIVSVRHRVYILASSQGPNPNPENSVERDRVYLYETSQYGRRTSDVYVTRLGNEVENPNVMGVVELGGDIFTLSSARESNVDSTLAVPLQARISSIRNGQFIGTWNAPSYGLESNLGVFDDKLWTYNDGNFYSSNDGETWSVEHSIDISAYQRTRVSFPHQNYSDKLTVLFATESEGTQTQEVIRFD